MIKDIMTESECKTVTERTFPVCDAGSGPHPGQSSVYPCHSIQCVLLHKEMFSILRVRSTININLNKVTK